MAYSDGTKQLAIDLYKSGKPRRLISEEMSISLSAINNWTAEVVSAPLESFTCPQCKRRRRRLNIQKKYCSRRCKNAANYRRSVQQAGGTAQQDRQCQKCGSRYTPKHGNAVRYCSKKCRQSASNQRRKAKLDLIKASEAAEQARIEAKQQDIDHCIKTLQEARRANLDTSTINRHRYSAEIATLGSFIREGNPTQAQQNVIQDLFRSVV